MNFYIIIIMEEKRSTSKKKSAASRRASKLKQSNKNEINQLITNQNISKKDYASKAGEKVLKRIGKVNHVKAFKQVIDQKQKNNDNKENKMVEKEQLYKAGVNYQKRIGKKAQVSAYIHSITQLDKKSDKTKSHPSTPKQPIILINNVVYDKSILHNNEISEQVKQEITQNESDILDSLMNSEETQQILLNRTNSESDCIDHQGINIKINQAHSEHQLWSQVEKSVNIDSANKSDSENAVYSEIAQGDLHKLINESSQNSLPEIDPKIQDLLLEIQKNHNKTNRQTQKKGDRQSVNFLSVPEKKRASQLKKAKEDKIKTQSFSQAYKNNEVLSNQLQQKQNSKTSQQRIMKTISQQSVKTIGEHQKGTKQQKGLNKPLMKVNIKSLKGKKIEEKKPNLSDLQMQQLTNSLTHQQKNNSLDSRLPSVPAAQINRLFASDKPKKTFRSIIGQQRMSLLGVGMQSRDSSISSIKISQSQILLDKVQVKTPNTNYSKSVHYSPNQNQGVLRKQSIATRTKGRESEIPKIKSVQKKISGTKKRNQKQFQVHKYVMEARKIIKND